MIPYCVAMLENEPVFKFFCKLSPFHYNRSYFPCSESAQSRPSVKWKDTEGSRREREFMSRYEQVTAANSDFKVFNSDLPGKTYFFGYMFHLFWVTFNFCYILDIH